MQELNPEDEFDWRGCRVVQWNPQMLGGRANVDGTRMFADGVLNNFDDGLTADEIAESYELDIEPVREIIAFASARRMKLALEDSARPQHATPDSQRDERPSLHVNTKHWVDFAWER